MIVGPCKNLFLPPEFMNAHWQRALDWLAGEGWKNISPGEKLEIAGTRVYASRTALQTGPFRNNRYEAHRRYADIHIALEGEETILVAGTDTLKSVGPYDPLGDCEFFEGGLSCSHWILLDSPALGVVVFPADAHQPCIACRSGPSALDKLVVKVCLD